MPFTITSKSEIYRDEPLGHEETFEGYEYVHSPVIIIHLNMYTAYNRPVMP